MSQSNLQRARSAEMPARSDVLRRAPQVTEFWQQNRDLFADAWAEWEKETQPHLPVLDNSLIDPALRAAVDGAWADPNTEQAVRHLWQEVTPGVFQAQFFDPIELGKLRTYMEDVWNSGIPLRAPYGLVLNRGGAMVDPRSEGHLAAPNFQTWYQQIINRYMRPIARLLFPEIFGYDGNSFGFYIQYRPTTDNSIQPHTDGSSVTLNLNLNLPDEPFGGSELNFYGTDRSQLARQLSFTPGMAVIHRGATVHAAQPITSGSRTNLVLWLYGRQGLTPPHLGLVGEKHADAHTRWAMPAEGPDSYAPF